MSTEGRFHGSAIQPILPACGGILAFDCQTACRGNGKKAHELPTVILHAELTSKSAIQNRTERKAPPKRGPLSAPGFSLRGCVLQCPLHHPRRSPWRQSRQMARERLL